RWIQLLLVGLRRSFTAVLRRNHRWARTEGTGGLGTAGLLVPKSPRGYRRPLLREGETVDLDLEQVVDADAVRPVGLHAGLGRRLHDGAVDDVVDLVGADAYFERVHRLPAGIRFLHGRVRSPRQHIGGDLTGALLHQPRPVLRDQEIGVALIGSLEVAAAEDETVVVRVAARLHQRERALQRVI